MSNDPNQAQQSQSAPAASAETPWKKVRNWLVAILVVLFVLYFGFTRVYSFIDSLHDYASDTANNYYTAIKNQDYATAFSYLAPGIQHIPSGAPLTKADFIQQARDTDTAKGPVKSYSITNSAPGAQSGTKSVTVTVTRNSAPYDVNLDVRQIATDNWLISKYDDI